MNRTDVPAEQVDMTCAGTTDNPHDEVALEPTDSLDLDLSCPKCDFIVILVERQECPNCGTLHHPTNPPVCRACREDQPRGKELREPPRAPREDALLDNDR